METLVANLALNKVQKKTLAGRSYLVAPVAMIVEGVFAGNQGPILYEQPDITKSVASWNHKPITVGHPKRGDQFVSGCLPESIEDFGVGMVLNTSWNARTKKLRAEAWFDESRLDVVPGGLAIKAALAKQEPMEVSTGLFVDKELSSGQYNGKEFTGKARNFRPDHLAVIVNGVGACSLKDGAGLLVNKNGQTTKQESKAMKNSKARLTVNQESLSSLVDDVEEAVKAAYGPKDPMTIVGEEDMVGVEDVFTDYVIYEIGETYFKESFTTQDGSVKLLGNRIQVVREVTYTPLVANEKVNMKRDEILAVLGDDHKDFVTNLSDVQVEALAKLQRTVTVEVPVANEVPKNLDELLASAPADVKAKIEEAFAVNTAHRDGLIEQIVTNEKNQFSKEELAGLPTATLSKMAVFAVNAAPAPAAGSAPAPLYAGSAAPTDPKPSTSAVKGFLPPSTFSAKA